MAAKKTKKTQKKGKSSRKKSTAGEEAHCKTVLQEGIRAGHKTAMKAKNAISKTKKSKKKAKKAPASSSSAGTAKKSTAKKSSRKGKTKKAASKARKANPVVVYEANPAKKSTSRKGKKSTSRKGKKSSSRKASTKGKKSSSRKGKKSSSRKSTSTKKKTTKRQKPSRRVTRAGESAALSRMGQATGLTAAEVREFFLGAAQIEKDRAKRGRTGPVKSKRKTRDVVRYTKAPTLAQAEEFFARKYRTTRAKVREVMKAYAADSGVQYKNNPTHSKKRRSSKKGKRRNNPVPQTQMLAPRAKNPVDLLPNPSMMGWKDVAIGVGVAAIGFTVADLLDRFLATMGKGKCDPFHGADAAARIMQKPGAYRLGVQLGVSVLSFVGAAYVSDERTYIKSGLLGLGTGFGTHFLFSLLNTRVMPFIFSAEKMEKDKLGSRLFPLEQKIVQDGLAKLIEDQNKICEQRKLADNERGDFLLSQLMGAAALPQQPAGTTPTANAAWIRQANARAFAQRAAAPRQMGVGNLPGRQPAQLPPAPNAVHRDVGVGATPGGMPLPSGRPAAAPAAAAANAPGHNHPAGQVGVAGCTSCSKGAQPRPRQAEPYVFNLTTELWYDARGTALGKGSVPMMAEAKARGAVWYNKPKNLFLTEKGQPVQLAAAAAPSPTALPPAQMVQENRFTAEINELRANMSAMQAAVESKAAEAEALRQQNIAMQQQQAALEQQVRVHSEAAQRLHENLNQRVAASVETPAAAAVAPAASAPVGRFRKGNDASPRRRPN